MYVYVINHTCFDASYKAGYYPLLVGAFNKSEEIKNNVFCDDTGSHISGFNDSYCELTGLYWIWKNVQVSTIGLVHYRRFFVTVKKRFTFHDNLYLLTPVTHETCHIMTQEEVRTKLEKYDLIVKMSRKFHWSIRNKLLDCITEECLENLENIMKSLHTEEYPAFKRYLLRHSHILFNMFIGKKVVLDRYCEWLFPILDAVDQKHKAATGERYHNREIGYLGEILFSYWIISRKVSYYAADTLIPRESNTTLIDGINFRNGTNIFSIRDFVPHLIQLVLRRIC